jgi:hypothetical protein
MFTVMFMPASGFFVLDNTWTVNGDDGFWVQVAVASVFSICWVGLLALVQSVRFYDEE